MKITLIRMRDSTIWPIIGDGLYRVNGHIISITVEKGVVMIYKMLPNSTWKYINSTDTFHEASNLVYDATRKLNNPPVPLDLLIGDYHFRDTYYIDLEKVPSVSDLWKNISKRGSYIMRYKKQFVRLTITNKRRYDVSTCDKECHGWEFVKSFKTLIGSGKLIKRLLWNK